MTFAPETPEVPKQDVQLYNTDFVVLIRATGEYLKSSRGEIIIYDNLKEAQEDARANVGFVACCTSLFVFKQEEIIKNIKQFRRNG